MEKNKIILEFLTELDAHNNREWFQDNKSRYLEAKDQFDELVQQVLNQLVVTQPQLAGLKAGDCTFRIYKDVRFSKDKLPYKTHMGAFMAPGGRKSIQSGCYLHFEPGNSFMGGGVYRPAREVLKAVRDEIYFNLAEYKALLADPDFIRYYGSITGDRLTRPPQGYPVEFEGMEYLKNKDFIMSHALSDHEICVSDLITKVVGVFNAATPLMNFYNRGIANAYLL